MNEPLISVIVPVYNVAPYLEQAMESLIDQSMDSNDIEVIVINDGSTDNSLQIATRYEEMHKNIKVYNQENKGYGITMNRGLSLATGKYIAILEPDDFVATTMFEDLYSVACKYKHNIPIIKSSYIYSVYINDDYTFKDIKETLVGVDKLSYNEDSVSYIATEPSILGAQPSIWAAIYQRKFLEENNIKFQETAGASFQDLPFYVETTIRSGAIAFKNTPYYYYRVNRVGGSSEINNNKGFVIFEIANYLFSRLEESDLLSNENRFYKNSIILLLYYSCIWNYKTTISDDRKEDFLVQVKNMLEDYKLNNELLYSDKIFDTCRFANDKKLNDVQLLMTRGARYLCSKLLINKSQNSLKLSTIQRLMKLTLKVIKQPIMLIIVFVLIPVNIIKQLFSITKELLSDK